MSRYNNTAAPLEYSKYGKVTDNFENVRRNNPYVTPKYDATQSRLARERMVAQSRSPIRRQGYNPQNTQPIVRRRQLGNSRVTSPYANGRSQYTADPYQNLRFYDNTMPVKRIFGNEKPRVFQQDPLLNQPPQRHLATPKISSKVENYYPKSPIEEDKRNSAYKQRYQDINFLAAKSSKLNSPNRSLRGSYTQSRRGMRNSTKVGRPRRASLTMKEALASNELKKHDVKEFNMYESPRPSETRGGMQRSSVRSSDSRIEYPNDPKLSQNNYSNFHSKDRRDRFVQEYPVVSNTNGYGSGHNRMNNMRRHIQASNREPTLCGSGDQACQLI